jgi:hypothetical protein
VAPITYLLEPLFDFRIVCLARLRIHQHSYEQTALPGSDMRLPRCHLFEPVRTSGMPAQQRKRLPSATHSGHKRGRSWRQWSNPFRAAGRQSDQRSDSELMKCLGVSRYRSWLPLRSNHTS